MATSYSGTVKYVFCTGVVEICVQGDPATGEKFLDSAHVKELTGPEVVLMEGDAITVEVENGEFVSIKKN